MSSGAIFSGLLHLAIILIVVFGLPWWYEPTEILEATPVTVVSADQLAQLQKSQRQPAQKQPAPKDTTIPQAPKAPALPEPEPEPEPAPAPEPQPKTQPEPAPTVEAPPEPQPEPPAPEPEPAPQPDQTEQEAVIAPPEPTPEPPPEPVIPQQPQVAEAQPKPLPPQKPKPPKKKEVKEKPKEKPKEEQAAEPDFASALIDKLSKKSKKQASQPEQTQEAALPPADYDGPPITEGEKDMIRQQVEGNWIVDVGMPGLEEMTVEINVQMNPDGTVQSAKVDPGGNNGNPNWTIFAESCRRAVLKSSPLRMPPEKPYPAWAKMTLVFNAKQMLGL
jgi:outer membrane biosynthesis protein TonB